MSEILKELPKVATNFYYECKKCEAERYHKVLAHKTETTAKIECEACGSKKTYKLPTPGAKKKKVTRKRKPRIKGSVEYAEMKDTVGEITPQPYKMSETYQVKQAINHPKFGMGYVFATTPEKIEVAFPEENRSFVQNRK